jgi:hypothetical protein
VSAARVITGTGVLLAWFAAAVLATVYWGAHQSDRAGPCENFCLSDRLDALIIALL